MEGRPKRGILTTVLQHQPYRAFTDFGGKFIRLVHGSILSKVGASSKPGAIQWHAALKQAATSGRAPKGLELHFGLILRVARIHYRTAVGSSAGANRGLWIDERAIATPCFSPPENLPVRVPARRLSEIPGK